MASEKVRRKRMNKVFIVGNLTKDPEQRTTQNGVSVCSFNVAVNRRLGANAEHPEADFFKVTAWRQLGENCARYLAKGRKVSVVGSVSASAYTGNDGQPKASLEITADDVEFLSPKGEAKEEAYIKQEREAIRNEPVQASMIKNSGGFIEVNEDDLPF